MNTARDTIDVRPKAATFWRPFGALLVLGMVGVVSLIPMLLAQLEAPTEDLPDIPTWVMVLVLLTEPVVLLAVAVAVGVLLAPKVGLKSLVADRPRGGTSVWPQLRPNVPLAVGLGLAVATAIVAVDGCPRLRPCGICGARAADRRSHMKGR